MVVKVVDPVGPGSDEVFEHATPYGVIRLPSLADMPAGVFRKLRKADPLEQLFGLIEAVGDDDALAVFDQLKASEVAAFQDAWSAFSGVSVGESAAS